MANTEKTLRRHSNVNVPKLCQGVCHELPGKAKGESKKKGLACSYKEAKKKCLTRVGLEPTRIAPPGIAVKVALT